MSGKKKDRVGKRNWQTGQLIRGAEASRESGEAAMIRPLSPISRMYLADRDYRYARARRSSGWKNSKCRHQWERRVRRLEKRMNRKSV